MGHTAEEHHQLELACEHYQRLASADPLREETHRGLMRCLTQSGQLARALAVYDNLTDVLEKELQAPPTAETRALAEMLHSELDQRRRIPPPLVGRDAERAQLLTRLNQARDHLRNVLQRLLAEAEAQNAAPTDDDLATALGVSRRTILRDMAVLAQTGLNLPTRCRK